MSLIHYRYYIMLTKIQSIAVKCKHAMQQRFCTTDKITANSVFGLL